MKRVAIFDIDGILADFLTPFNQYLRSKLRIEVNGNDCNGDFPTFYRDKYKINWDEELDAYYKSGSSLLQPADNEAIKLVNRCKNQYKILIVTARPKSAIMEQETESWLYLVGCMYDKIVFAEDKAEIANFYGAAFIVDDNPKYDFSRVRKLFLKDYWYNRDIKGNNVTRFKKFADLQNYI